MSFGSSTKSRFELETTNKGKAGIFFLGKDIKPKPTRKYGYKERALRHPIRNTASKAENHQFEETQIINNKKPLKPDKNFIKKNRDKLAGKSVHNEKNKPLNGGTVTLTQEQLNAILESVGNLREGKENALRISIDTKSNAIKIDSPRKDEDPKSSRSEKSVKVSSRRDKKEEEGNILGLLLNQEKDKIEDDRKSDNTDVENFKKDITARKEKEKTSLEDNQSKKIEKSETSKDIKSSPERKKKSEELSKSKDSPLNIPPVPLSHLTVAEKKRLQWALEKGETESYDPWGRPGAGAPPIKPPEEEDKRQNNLPRFPEANNTSPKHITKYSTSPKQDKQHHYGTLNIGHLLDQNDQQSKKEENQRILREELAKQLEEKRLQKRRQREQENLDDTFANQLSKEHKPAPLPPQPAKFVSSTSSKHNTPREEYEPQVPKVSPRWVQDQKVPPAAMRSSFAFGGLALDDTKYKQTKEEERRKWLEELEKQKEEKRLLSMTKQEKQRQRDAADAAVWAEKVSSRAEKTSQRHNVVASQLSPRYTSKATSLQQHNIAATSSPRYELGLQQDSASQAIEVKDSARVNSAPTDTQSSPTLIRGQNVIIDPVTLKDLEMKRQRHLELQDAIKNQIDEKKNQVRLEREKKWAEEQEEEQRLQREREVIQKQFELEQQKIREKEQARDQQLQKLKYAMDEAQGRALHEKHLKRMQRLQQGGHDITNLKANYDVLSPSPSIPIGRSTATSVARQHTDNQNAMTPRVQPMTTQQQSAYVPQLNLTDRDIVVDTSIRSHHSDTDQMADVNQSKELVHHDDYVEDKIVSYRNLSDPHTDPYSTRRHFVTDENGVKREVSDVRIEYKADRSHRHRRNVPTEADVNEKKMVGTTKLKKVRLKSAAQVRKFKTEKPKPKEKFGWNYNNQKVKKNVKNSEKDPFYEQKKWESQARHAKRAAQLYKMVEANKQIIPTGSRSPSPHRNKSLSPYRGSVNSRHDRSLSPNFRSETRLVKPSDVSPRRGRSTSPLPSNRSRHSEELKPFVDEHERRSRLDHYKHRPDHHARYESPPVPAVKHRRPHQNELDNEDYDNYNGRSHYTDLDPVRPPVYDTDFIPFTRTSEILDPSHADDPLRVSRENTRVRKGRKAYNENQQPADYGNRIDIYEDKRRDPNQKNPILNPGLVKDHPTGRQDQILQQLSTLKQSLIQRQRELETCMSPSDFEQQ
ncbi:hypothetical protein SNE40_015356 [Patella caerulea]|uniref:CCDC66 domain-containing protein n=1 Tax=Patella caerulea TaxID=87958 RepID=A0AAN8PV25_PATCE